MDLSKAGVGSAGEREEMGAPDLVVHWQYKSCTFLYPALGKDQERVWEAESIEML